jgi:hypothetical protein
MKMDELAALNVTLRRLNQRNAA